VHSTFISDVQIYEKSGQLTNADNRREENQPLYDPTLQRWFDSVNDKTDESNERQRPEGDGSHSANTVRDTVREQLTKLGINEDYSDSLGALIDAGLGTFARREGMSKEDFFDALGVRFEKEDLGGDIRGRITFRFRDGGTPITFTPNSDVTTGIHEASHLFNVLMERQVRKFKDDAQLQDDWRHVQQFVGCVRKRAKIGQKKENKR
jgi:hypothetical protein